MVNMGELFANDRLRNVPMDRVPLAGKERADNLLRPGDLLFARQSLVRSGAGQSSIFLGDSEDVCFESHLIRCRLNLSESDPQFYYYWFRSPDGRNAIDSIVEQGAGASGIRGSDLAKLMVPQPALDEQKSICEQLTALDDKIELNRRMNATLEAMAQALFKEWFVDGAKEEWKEKPFADTVHVFAGGTPKTIVAEYWDGDIPWFAIADAGPTNVYVTDTARKVTQAGIDNSSAQIVKAGTTILTARGTVGQTVLTGVPMAMNQSCFGLWGIHDVHGYFTYFQTKHIAEQFKQYSHGSVFSTINRSTFGTLRVVMPDADTVNSFEELVHPMMQRILGNINESHTLTALRDTLLPKLMRGEVRVKADKLHVQ